MSANHASTLARMRAVLTSPTLYRLAQQLEWDRPVGRPPANPTYAVLAFGVLARVARSGVRVQLDLAEPATWAMVRSLMNTTIERHGLDLPPPGRRPPRWDHWRWLRDEHLATDPGLVHLAAAYTPLAVATAHSLGLLLPDGPGTFTHPHPARAVYGDGTLVRPLYRPPEAVALTQDDGSKVVAYPDRRTGLLHQSPTGRFDPDLQLHHGQRGSVQTHGYVCWHTRGPALYERVVLAADHIPVPGAEAATAVQLLASVHRAAGPGIQAVIYDGALHGVHIDQIMTRYGYLVLTKLPTASATDDPSPAPLTLNDRGRRARSYPLGNATHHTPTGDCTHQLAAIDGRVVDIGLDETGDPVVVADLHRGAVKRSRRSGGQYHFNIGYHLECPTEPFTVWLSPHPGPGGDTHRPQNLRIIAPTDPDFPVMYGLRNDAESFHANLKRTLLVDRAMSLGWRRGLVDVYCFALLNNALAEAAAQTRAEQRPHGASRRVGPPRHQTA